MKLSKQTLDAVEILVFCVQPDDALLKVGDVAKGLDLSKQMALKLAYLLNQEGFLEAARGPKGGIRLTETAKTATLGEVVRALELQPAQKAQGDGNALFSGYIDEAFEAFVSVLDQHSLADLAKRPRTATRKKPAKKASRQNAKAAPVIAATSRKRSTAISSRTRNP